MPVYNAAPFILEAAHSVLAQEYQNWELLVVDDGSTDGGVELLEQEEDRRIHIFRQPNRGVSSARNVGLENMNGEYFCFLDADDLLTPRSISSRIQLFTSDTRLEFVDGIVRTFPAENYSQTLHRYTPGFRGNPRKPLLELSEDCFFGPTWMIKNLKGKRYRFDEDVTHGEDLLFYISISASGIYTAVNEPVYEYRTGHASAMQDLDGLAEGYRSLLEKLRNDLGFTETALKGFRDRIRSILFKSYVSKWRFIKALKVLLL